MKFVKFYRLSAKKKGEKAWQIISESRNLSALLKLKEVYEKKGYITELERI